MTVSNTMMKPLDMMSCNRICINLTLACVIMVNIILMLSKRYLLSAVWH